MSITVGRILETRWTPKDKYQFSHLEKRRLEISCLAVLLRIGSGFSHSRAVISIPDFDVCGWADISSSSYFAAPNKNAE